MELYFGLSADGRTYPETPGSNGVVDTAVLGPAGLVELLEVQLGLSAPTTPSAVRIADYLVKLRDAAGGPHFWANSFARDSWATAAMLLRWRDELIAGGWTGGRIGQARVDALAAAEAAGQPLARGLADRAVALIAALPHRPGLRLQRLITFEPADLLPPVWRRLLAVLQSAGVTIIRHDGRTRARDSSDLEHVQRALDGDNVGPLAGDGTLVVIDADTAIMAADVVADWLAAGSTEDLEGTVVLAPDGNTSLVDRALRARGLPALGLSAASPWRGALQVLPLAFAIAWRPFDANALLNLLMLPRPPVPRFVAARLARALSKEPGLGGRAWEKAWAEISEIAAKMNADVGDRAAKTAAQVARWESWTIGGHFDRAAGIPAAEAKLIAGRVSAWAMEADSGDGDPLLLAVSAAATALSKAIDRIAIEVLPALLLERIVSQVLADGIQNPDHRPEAGGLRAIRAPGALWNPAPRLIWWNFVGPGERVSPLPWSAAERAAFSDAGVELEAAATAAARISASYRETLQRVSERVLLIRPTLSGSERAVVHPLAHQLRPIFKDAGPDILFKAENVLRDGERRLAGRTLTRRQSEPADQPAQRASWTAPAPALARLDARRESATSLGRLFNCQLGWFVEDVLGLRSGVFAQIPGLDQLFGTLAHEIARRLLPPGPPPPVENIRALATELFEELTPQIAAPLQQPEAAGELAAARALVPAALEALVRLMHAHDLEIVGTELEREGQTGGLALHGRLDLVVKKGSTSAVMDLKWTRSENRYREEIEEGRAVQLAVYRGIAGGSTEFADGGYFLLRQRRMLAPSGSILADGPLDAARSNLETLQVATADWRVWRDLTTAGIIVAAGAEGAGELRPTGLGFAEADEPCRFCDLTGLCRMNVEAV